VTGAKAEAPAPGAGETDRASPMEQRWGGRPYPSEAILRPALNLIAHPRGPRMKCGWGRGEQLTGRNMRAHFTICPNRPAASEHVDRRARSPKVKLKVKRATYRGGDCCAAGAAAPGSQRAQMRARFSEGCG
jgi:hypothetical protein